MCEVHKAYKNNQHMRKPLKLKYLRGVERKYRPQIKERLNHQVHGVITKSLVDDLIAYWETLSKSVKRATPAEDEMDKYIQLQLTKAEELKANSSDNKKMQDIIKKLYVAAFVAGLLADKRKTYADFIKTKDQRLIDIADNISFNVKLTNPTVLSTMDKAATQVAADLNNTTFIRIKNFLRTEVTSNHKTDQIIKNISKLEGVNLRRSYNITRDQVMISKNYEVETYLKRRGYRAWTWTCNQPEDMACIVNCGTTRLIGDPFPSGHIKPQVHKNCECYTISQELDPSSPDYASIIGWILIGIDWSGE